MKEDARETARDVNRITGGESMTEECVLRAWAELDEQYRQQEEGQS